MRVRSDSLLPSNQPLLTMGIPSRPLQSPSPKSLNQHAKPFSIGRGTLDWHDDVFADEMLVAWVLSLKAPSPRSGVLLVFFLQGGL